MTASNGATSERSRPGLAFFHSLSILFLAVFALNYAHATRSRVAAGTCLLLLLFDPTQIITPALSYSLAGKNDVLLAALILQVWAVLLDRQNTQPEAIDAREFFATNAIAACAVGMKTSAALAVGLPLLVYWIDFAKGAIPRPSRTRLALTLAGAGLGWLFFCWQYVANVFILGSVVDKGMAVVGMSHSLLGLFRQVQSRPDPWRG